MSKFAKAIIAAAALLAVTGPAAADERQVLVDGVRYTYTSAQAADGSTVLTGYTSAPNSKFRLVVRNGKVTGRVGGSTVAYDVADARGAARGANAVAVAD